MHVLKFILYINSGCSIDGCVGCGMVKLLWPHEETRTSLGRKFIMLSGPIEGVLRATQGHRGSVRLWSGGRR